MNNNYRFRALINGEMKSVQAIFWDNSFKHITEIRYFNSQGEIEALNQSQIVDTPIMQSTGFKETGGDRDIYEGDVVEAEYQYGIALCVVRWCNIKYSVILDPVKGKGKKPVHKPHFRIPGKKSIVVRGNIYQNKNLVE